MHIYHCVQNLNIQDTPTYKPCTAKIATRLQFWSWSPCCSNDLTVFVMVMPVEKMISIRLARAKVKETLFICYKVMLVIKTRLLLCVPSTYYYRAGLSWVAWVIASMQ